MSLVLTANFRHALRESCCDYRAELTIGSKRDRTTKWERDEDATLKHQLSWCSFPLNTCCLCRFISIEPFSLVHQRSSLKMDPASMMQNPQMMAMANAMMADPEVMEMMQQPGVSTLRATETEHLPSNRAHSDSHCLSLSSLRSDDGENSRCDVQPRVGYE